MMQQRGLSACHTTIMRWVHQYAKEFKKRLKKFLKTSNDSYRIDEKKEYGIIFIKRLTQMEIHLNGCSARLEIKKLGKIFQASAIQ